MMHVNYSIKYLYILLTARAYITTITEATVLTGESIRVLQVAGRKQPLAEGKTPINCSRGLNCR